LAGLYVEYRQEDANKRFFVVATNGYIIARKECDYDSWELLQYAIREEWNAEIPNLPESGMLFLTPAMRKIGQAKTLWVTTEPQTDPAIPYVNYPQYRNVFPSEFSCKLADMPIFAIDILVKYQKIAKAFGHKAKMFFPTGWNTELGIAIKEHDSGLYIGLMPMRVVERCEYT
jgi:hypothetical protein